MSDPSDADDIRRSLAEPQVFGALFDRYFATVHRYLARRVGTDLADDLSGEVFRIAFERRSSYDLRRALARPWLYGIATRVLARHRRDEERRLRAHRRVSARSAAEPPAPDDGLEERLDASAAGSAVLAALAALPPEDRDPLLLVAWEDLSYAEVAEALGIPIGTVRSRIHRARSRLRRRLAAAATAGAAVTTDR